MIKLENTDVYGWEAAIRGMRNPMNSWDKSDSEFEYVIYDNDLEAVDSVSCIDIGPNDLTLMKKLIKAGSDHRKFMRQIIVSVDITAPLYWYKEFDTYKVGTVANSCSTMHKIHAKEFVLEDFSCEHLRPVGFSVMENVIEALNSYRERYLETKNKNYWWQMIQLLPSSYNQKRTITLNYEVLINMYHARKNHKLDEWRDFCDWVKTLPYSELIIGE
jgi:hypothetical protein